MPPPELVECRWHFSLPWPAVPRLRGLRLSSSVRLVALDARRTAPTEALAHWACGQARWHEVLRAWRLLGNGLVATCHVCLRRRRGGAFEDSLGLRRCLAVEIERRLKWTPEVQRHRADLEVHVVVAVDGRLLLEVPLLVQQRGLSGGLPFPGMKQVEAWALAKSLEIQAGEKVLDPMCGKGTLLAESALWWPEADYIGCDLRLDQLEKCRANHRYLGRHVQTHLADVRDLPFETCSVDKLLTAPPWDRQFEASGGLQDFYPSMLAEVNRVLKPSGSMALLLNTQAEEVLRPLLEAWQSCQCRFAVTKHTVGILLVAWKAGARDFHWWQGAKGLKQVRSAWKALRSESRPPLHPKTSGS